MKKMVLLLVVLVALALSTWWILVDRKLEPQNLSSLLEEAEMRSTELALPKAQPTDMIEWNELLQQVALENRLVIEIGDVTPQQVELSIETAPVEQLIHGFAQLFAMGLRVQSIRLLGTDNPDEARVKSVTLTTQP